MELVSNLKEVLAVVVGDMVWPFLCARTLYRLPRFLVLAAQLSNILIV